MKKQGKSFRRSNQVGNELVQAEARERARDREAKVLPSIQDQLCVGMTLRFITTAAFTGSFGVTVGNLLDAMFIAGTATTAYQLFDFVKLKRVTIRGMGNSVGVAAGVAPNCTVGIDFFGISASTFTGGKQKSNTSLGRDTPAFLSVKPDPRSQAAQYQANSTNSLFVVRAVDAYAIPVIGAIVDVEVVYRNSADVNPAALGTARAGLTPGHVYFGALDGATDAATQCRSAFVPRA